jgi:hypothetical protein
MVEEELPLKTAIEYSSATDLFFLPCHKTIKQTNATESSALLVAAFTSSSSKVDMTHVNPEEESSLKQLHCPPRYTRTADPLSPFQLGTKKKKQPRYQVI